MTTLDELQALAAKMEAVASLKEQFYQAARAYFTGRLQQTDGLMTPDIVREIDALYDITGFHKHVLRALDLPMGEIRRVLGKQRQIQCEQCGTPFVVVDLRCQHGFTPSKETLCELCRKKQAEEERQDWKNWRLAENAEEKAALSAGISQKCRRYCHCESSMARPAIPGDRNLRVFYLPVP